MGTGTSDPWPGDWCSRFLPDSATSAQLFETHLVYKKNQTKRGSTHGQTVTGGVKYMSCKQGFQ